MDDSGIDFILPTQGFRAGPPKLVPRFYTVSKKDEEASKREGRIVCKEVEMIELRVPGNAKDVYHERVWEKWIKEYPQEYEHWKATNRQRVEGTPITEYPKMNASRRMELQLSGILTCEQFISLSDGQLQKLGMGARTEQAEMKAWIDAARDSAIVTRQAAENQALKDQLMDLQRQIKEINDRAIAEASKPRRPTLSVAKSDG